MAQPVGFDPYEAPLYRDSAVRAHIVHEGLIGSGASANVFLTRVQNDAHTPAGPSYPKLIATKRIRLPARDPRDKLRYRDALQCREEVVIAEVNILIAAAKEKREDIIRLYSFDLGREETGKDGERHETVDLRLELATHGALCWWLYDKKSSDDLTRPFQQTALQISSALIFLQAHNLIHGDLKPENILIFALSPFTIRVADCGAVMSPQRLENHGTSLCTSWWRAPEARGPREALKNTFWAGFALDSWSLGRIMMDFVVMPVRYVPFRLVANGAHVQRGKVEADSHSLTQAAIDFEIGCVMRLPSSLLLPTWHARYIKLLVNLLCTDVWQRWTPHVVIGLLQQSPPAIAFTPAVRLEQGLQHRLQSQAFSPAGAAALPAQTAPAIREWHHAVRDTDMQHHFRLQRRASYHN